MLGSVDVYVCAHTFRGGSDMSFLSSQVCTQKMKLQPQDLGILWTL